MIYVTGDCHGDIRRFMNFPEEKNMDRSDHMIVCGDLGLIWNGSRSERVTLDWLEEKPYTLLWVDGNHENYDMLKTFPVEEWHGGKVHRIRSNVLHLKRGQVFEINGRTVFTMGGAQSHDIEDGLLNPNDPDFKKRYIDLLLQGKRRFRIIGSSWWPEELPSDEEYAEALASLERVNWQVDYVVTHCAPTSIALTMSRHNEADRLTDFLEMVSRKLTFHHWFFGHYHDNGHFGQKYILLYKDILKLED